MNHADRGRRTVLQGAAGLLLAWLAPAGANAQDKPESSRPATGDRLIRVGDGTLTPLTPGDIALASAPVVAWPMSPDQVVRSGSRLNRVLLLRFEPDALGAATRPLAAGGVVAYSAICTHSGCEAADWLADEQQLHCQCHDSRFDPRDGARVLDGPAPRSLPALPLDVADGCLVVARPFTTRVGFTEG